MVSLKTRLRDLEKKYTVFQALTVVRVLHSPASTSVVGLEVLIDDNTLRYEGSDVDELLASYFNDRNISTLDCTSKRHVARLLYNESVS